MSGGTVDSRTEFEYDGDFKNRYGNYYVPPWAQEMYQIGIFHYKGCGDLYIGETQIPVGSTIKLTDDSVVEVWNNGKQLDKTLGGIIMKTNNKKLTTTQKRVDNHISSFEKIAEDTRLAIGEYDSQEEIILNEIQERKFALEVIQGSRIKAESLLVGISNITTGRTPYQ